MIASVRDWGVQGRRPVVALGEFDGFHLGHRDLLDAASRIARRESCPLVAVVLDDGRGARLGAERDREVQLLAAGAGATCVVHVPSTGERPSVATEVVDFLVRHLDPRVVVMACLVESEATAHHPHLRPAVRLSGLELVEVDRRRDASGQPLTSARIASAVRAGDVGRAAEWLGRPYRLSGEVVRGNALGRTIGFPTANLVPPPVRVLPGFGVYAGSVRLASGAVHPAAINVGVRPTVVDSGLALLEAHLIDFDGDLYGSVIDISFCERLRGETRFDSLDALVDQLAVDTRRARDAFRP